MSFLIAVAPVFVTGMFAWVVTKSNQRHETAAQARQEVNSQEHQVVVDGLNNLTEAMNGHLAWHLNQTEE